MEAQLWVGAGEKFSIKRGSQGFRWKWEREIRSVALGLEGGQEREEWKVTGPGVNEHSEIWKSRGNGREMEVGGVRSTIVAVSHADLKTLSLKDQKRRFDASPPSLLPQPWKSRPEGAEAFGRNPSPLPPIPLCPHWVLYSSS